jgi:hypothetical protein
MPRVKAREPQLTFRSPHGPAVSEWALAHGVIKGTGKYAKAHNPEEPEANVSEALNLLIAYALDHYDPEPAELAGEPAEPKLTDRDRAVLDHLVNGPARIAVQSMPVDPASGYVSVQTARRLSRLGLVAMFAGPDGTMAKRVQTAEAAEG